MLRKYVLEVSLVKTLESAIPIFKDVDMPAGGLHRFSAVIQVEKTRPQHDGFERNAMMAAFGALKDLDFVIVVGEDIDIRNQDDVNYALAMRFDAARDLIVVPDARGHEMVRASVDGFRSKLGLDASVPFAQKEKFRRIEFAPVEKRPDQLTVDRDLVLSRLNIG